MAEFLVTTVPDTTGETVVTVPDTTGETVVTVPDTTGETVTPITKATVTEVVGKTPVPITETTVPEATVTEVVGKTPVPITETTVPGMTTMAIMLGHKNISTSELPSVESFSSSTVKISRESTFFFNSTAKQLTLEDKLVRSTSAILTFGPGLLF
ncbi:hypothetical protein G0U57_003917 [Chelydra serpentina]|uniref:Uncharacterized protein n=1 Tax=Chelydra serpentina TaxID=8475 RepID=A0A8T1SN58_CHESE|nr:hypothetical protein G0U57_003917 [Chelydra serpentina]